VVSKKCSIRSQVYELRDVIIPFSNKSKESKFRQKKSSQSAAADYRMVDTSPASAKTRARWKVQRLQNGGHVGAYRIRPITL